MLSEKIIKYLEEEPQLLEENKEMYRTVLEKNGFKGDSTFVAFATTYGTEFNGSEGFMFNVVRDLMDESSTGVNYNMHSKQNVPSNLISLLDDTTYAFLLYNKDNDSVILIEDGDDTKIKNENFDKKWNSFNEFLEDFFELN